MNETWGIALCVAGFLIAMLLGVPWFSYFIEKYWSWCLRKQREMRNGN